MDKATFAAGCFWCIENEFNNTKGVKEAVSGYIGGKSDNPTYQDVCSGQTGHAEAVEIIFDSSIISYDQLLDIFFSIHDASQLNRQGPDVGSQYRSAIFYHTEDQRKLAELSIKKWNSSNRFQDPIVTELVKAEKFYKAEEYHQRYYEKMRGPSA